MMDIYNPNPAYNAVGRTAYDITPNSDSDGENGIDDEIIDIRGNETCSDILCREINAYIDQGLELITSRSNLPNKTKKKK